MNATTLERRSDLELVIKRRFDAAPDLVYAAWTQPELLARWWAPKSHATLFECDADVRVGGTYRFVFGKRRDQAVAFSGTYREVVPNSRLVYTEIFEPMRAAGEALVTVTFTANAGGTEVVILGRHPSKQGLDAVIASGMEHGMRESMEQLDALLAA